MWPFVAQYPEKYAEKENVGVVSSFSYGAIELKLPIDVFNKPNTHGVNTEVRRDARHFRRPRGPPFLINV